MEKVWRKISALLMDNNEHCPQPIQIPIGEDEAMGLSTNDMPMSEYVFQDEKEGMILIKIEGYDYPIDLSDLPDEVINNVCDELIKIKGYTPQLIG